MLPAYISSVTSRGFLFLLSSLQTGEKGRRVSPRAAPAVGSAPTEHVDSPSLVPCPAVCPGPPPWPPSPLPRQRYPRVPSRVGESFTHSASCSGGAWAPFLICFRPSALPVARTRRTVGPARPRLSVHQAGWLASARGAGCLLPRPEGLMHFTEKPQPRRAPRSALGPHPSSAPAARRPESPAVATGRGKDVSVASSPVCPRAEAGQVMKGGTKEKMMSYVFPLVIFKGK